MTGPVQAIDAVETPPFEPTEEQRRLVRAMAGFGLPQENIAVLIDVDMDMLRARFRHELDRGAAEGIAKVAQTLFQMATVDKNVSAVIFWMKARAGWREKVAVNGEDGSQIVFDVIRYVGEASPGPSKPTIVIPHDG